MLLYQAALLLSTRTLHYTAGLIRSHRKAIRSRWRALDPGAQALLTLAYLHQGHTYEQLAVVTPYKGKGKPEYQKAHNRLHTWFRGPGERMFAELKKWRILQKLRCDPHRAAHIACAIATLNLQERQSG